MIQLTEAQSGRVNIAGQPYQRGLLQVRYGLDGTVTIQDAFGSVLLGVPFAEFVNPSTGLPFASLIDLKAFVEQNFFRIRGAGATPLPPDADAIAFLQAAGIDKNATYGTVLGAAIWEAMDVFVKDLKGKFNTNYATANTWDKFRALYPFVGGTSASHRWNLKDPRDLDAAFRLTFAGSPTHSASGVEFAPGQSAQTNIIPSAHLPGNSIAVGAFGSGWYNRTFCYSYSGSADSAIQFLSVGANFYWDSYNAHGNAARITVPLPDDRALITANRVSALENYIFKNGASVVSGNGISGIIPSSPLVLLGPATNSFGFVAAGLTPAEMVCVSSAINALQSSLNR